MFTRRFIVGCGFIGLAAAAVLVIYWVNAQNTATPPGAKVPDPTDHQTQPRGMSSRAPDLPPPSPDRHEPNISEGPSGVVSPPDPDTTTHTAKRPEHETDADSTATDDKERIDAAAAAISQTRQQRMMNVRDVIFGCYSLIDQLNGDWPADAAAFAELQKVGHMFEVIQGRAEQSNRIAENLSALPTLVYRRPQVRLDDPNFDPNWVVFHELVGDDFPEDGIAVGFADGHIEWIADEDAFEALLDSDG